RGAARARRDRGWLRLRREAVPERADRGDDHGDRRGARRPSARARSGRARGGREEGERAAGGGAGRDRRARRGGARRARHPGPAAARRSPAARCTGGRARAGRGGRPRGPAGVYAEVGGEYQAAAAARTRLLGLGGLALLGIFVLLVLDFGSVRLAGLTMVNVPLAFVGGVVAVLLGAGGRLSLGAIVGFVTVFGITIRNGIVLVAHFLHVEEARGGPLDRAAVVAAAADRLAPILMTALTTGIAPVPP